MAIKKVKRFKKLNNDSLPKEDLVDVNVRSKLEQKVKCKQLKRKRKFEVERDQEDFDERSSGIQEIVTRDNKKRKLEVASDQEDSDEDDCEGTSKAQSGQIVVTMKMVKKWEKLIHENIHEALKELGEAFKAVVQTNETKDDGKDEPSRYFVKTTNVSDAIINACIVELVPSVIEHLNLPKAESALPTSSCRWKKIKNLMKPYLLDLLKLLDQMTNAGLFTTLMKHTFQVTPMFVCFPKIIKPFIKKIIDLWGSSSDTIRILCFRCLYLVVTYVNDKISKHIFLNLYLMAMKNSQFTTVNSLPAINYMKTSLIDLYCLKPSIAYECVFRSLQQISMYLLGVLNQKNKKKTQLINWRFCHSLSIFADFIGKRKDDENTNKLIHTVSDIILGTINLYHSPSYMPMWLFCARILIQLMEQTGLYVQILPVIFKPLKTSLFDKTPKVGKMKSCVFSVCLRMNKKELKEKAFQDEVIDEVFELLITYASSLAHKITFPELILKDMLILKEYIKKSKASIYVMKFKQALEKIKKRCSEIEKIRNTQKVNLRDLESIAKWENKLRDDGCELKTFCNSWIKTRLRILELQSSNKDQICTDDLPTIKRPEPKKATEEDRERFKTLFKFGDDEEDEDDEDDDEERDADIARFQPKDDKSTKKSLRTNKLEAKKAKIMQDEDSCSDFDEDELELLARSSASGNEEDSDDNNINESDFESDDDEPDVVKELDLGDDSDVNEPDDE